MSDPTSNPPENLDQEPEISEPVVEVVDEEHVQTDEELVDAVGISTGHAYEPLAEGGEPGILEVSVVANAIGWLFASDGREVVDHDGVPMIEVSGTESALTIAAASRAIVSLDLIRARGKAAARSSSRGRRGTATDRARRDG